jgi:pyruvate kinase
MKINFRKSKIVGKLADNKSEAPFLQSLYDAGVDVSWLNTAHQSEADADLLIARIRSVSTRTAIMLDTKGPEIRTKGLENPFPVKSGDVIHISGNLEHHNEGAQMVHVDYPNFHNEVPVGTIILYDDATVGFTVTEKEGDSLKCIAQNTGTIKNKKSINVPGVHIKLPSLTEKDKGFIRWCAKNNVEYIIHSFVRNKQDLMDIKKITDEFPSYKPSVISKIENREGFDNLAEILDNSDGVMVARGDLGAEVPFEEMPFMQKKMVEMCVKKGKACIVATQVLDSMIRNPRPTRAEVLDVANAVLEGSGAVSMSGETAYGDYPVEATTLMSKIMAYTEDKKDELTHHSFWPEVNTPAFSKAKEIADAAKKDGSKAILAAVADTKLYYALAAWRPSCVTIAACADDKEVRMLSLYYSIEAMHIAQPSIAEVVKNIDTGTFTPTDKVTVVEETAAGITFKTVAFKDVA